MFIITSFEIALRWMLHNKFDDKSTLVQVMTYSIRQQAIAWVMLTQIYV